MTQHLQPAELPITEEDEVIREALQSASIPALMMSMVHLSGDAGLLRGGIRPGSLVLNDVQGSLSNDDKAAVRAQAFELLKDYRDRGCTLPPAPSPETIHEMMSFVVGSRVADDYVPMMLEEMALDGEDARVVDWTNVPEAVRRDFHVVVIGAGMSGLLTAIRLEEAGIPYTVIEKNAGVGGTWLENTYPGCRVDVGNHFYCYSFEPNHDWSEFFARQQELRAYFESCSEKYGVDRHIRFQTEVRSARFDEARGKWTVEIRSHEGVGETLDANVVVSAVGQLNRAKTPDIPGLESFGGASFHSAEWRHDVPLEGRRVAVVGTGASALQLVPEVATQAERLFVFQRSPTWIAPNPRYHSEVSEGMKWLLKHVPYYARWYRFLIFWPGSDGLMPSLVIDPSWPHPERSVNALNDGMREVFTNWMRSQLKGDEALASKVIPRYPPFCKRMLQDNGSWLSTLRRDDVSLVTDGISEIRGDAIVCDDGTEIPVDVIIFATGFHANRFLWPMEIVGTGGTRLRELWGELPRAYLGITIPDFPNFFMLYGPGTNLAHAGSIIFHSECQVRYIMGCIKGLMERGASSMDCRPEVFDAFNRKLEDTLDGLIWSYPGVNSWYKNREGKVTTTSPWLLLDYWRWTREPEFDDYRLS